MVSLKDDAGRRSRGWDESTARNGAEPAPLGSPEAAGPTSGPGPESVDELDEGWDEEDGDNTTGVVSTAPPRTEEVDAGWDEAATAAGRRRRHRPRRVRTAEPAPRETGSSIVAPRPAEPSKKELRDLRRRQAAQGAKRRTEQKEERRLARRVEATRTAEAEREALHARARERAERERNEAAERAGRRAKRVATGKKVEREPPRAKARAADARPTPDRRAEAQPTPAPSAASTRTIAPSDARRGRRRLGVILTLAVLMALFLLLLTKK